MVMLDEQTSIAASVNKNWNGQVRRGMDITRPKCGSNDELDGLLQDWSTLDTWVGLVDAATWGGLEAGLVRAVTRQLGDAELESLPVLGEMPTGEDADSLTEKAQWWLVLSAIRVKYGAPSLFAAASSHAPKTPVSGGVAAGSSGTKLKLKMSQIIEGTICCDRGGQPTREGGGDRWSIELPIPQAAVWPTSLCGYGSVGDHTDRIAHAMRFVSQQWRDGQWKAVELPGAANLDAWEESWRIFRTGALMLQLATAATLDRYASEFRTRADIRCRTEFWSQEKRKQEAFHSTHPALFAFIPGQPWNSVIRASASHSEFWSREFEKPAMLYGPMKPQPKKKVGGAFDPQRKDGQYFRSKAGINICYAWAADGCSNDRCDKGPGWTPEKKDKSKGKGKGRGGGNPSKRQKHM
ncbi:unnamed protein product [Durusdinium trenchii]|uniref:Phospholipase B-like n=1 Tax=Durusdinium trenchii TaxID=1381693 RepID=A0ABP0PP45_9DINO